MGHCCSTNSAFRLSFFVAAFRTNIIPLGTALWIYAIIAIASEAHFFIVGFSELADALGIKVFKTGLEKKEIL